MVILKLKVTTNVKTECSLKSCFYPPIFEREYLEKNSSFSQPKLFSGQDKKTNMNKTNPLLNQRPITKQRKASLNLKRSIANMLLQCDEPWPNHVTNSLKTKQWGLGPHLRSQTNQDWKRFSEEKKEKISQHLQKDWEYTVKKLCSIHWRTTPTVMDVDKASWTISSSRWETCTKHGNKLRM